MPTLFRTQNLMGFSSLLVGQWSDPFPYAVSSDRVYTPLSSGAVEGRT
jgi:hypothetical protein